MNTLTVMPEPIWPAMPHRTQGAQNTMGIVPLCQRLSKWRKQQQKVVKRNWKKCTEAQRSDTYSSPWRMHSLGSECKRRERNKTWREIERKKEKKKWKTEQHWRPAVALYLIIHFLCFEWERGHNCCLLPAPPANPVAIPRTRAS